MKRSGAFRKLHVACLTAVCAASVGAIICAYFRVWSPHDWMSYRTVQRHSAVAHDLWHGRLRAGTDLADVIRREKPHLTREAGPYVELCYCPGGRPPPGSISLEETVVIAKDRRLVYAASNGCTFERIYFDEFSDADESEFFRLLAVARAERQRHKAGR